eukprot:GHVH01015508.1.p1 GENE.GHVH01015508.1~~GHVH01015508.1.p1  ORF type:complete len:298 (+),score=35.78 GHVH01015508.1:14-907(+)
MNVSSQMNSNEFLSDGKHSSALSSADGEVEVALDNIFTSPCSKSTCSVALAKKTFGVLRELCETHNDIQWTLRQTNGKSQTLPLKSHIVIRDTSHHHVTFEWKVAHGSPLDCFDLQKMCLVGCYTNSIPYPICVTQDSLTRLDFLRDLTSDEIWAIGGGVVTRFHPYPLPPSFSNSADGTRALGELKDVLQDNEEAVDLVMWSPLGSRGLGSIIMVNWATGALLPVLFPRRRGTSAEDVSAALRQAIALSKSPPAYFKLKQKGYPSVRSLIVPPKGDAVCAHWVDPFSNRCPNGCAF